MAKTKRTKILQGINDGVVDDGKYIFERKGQTRKYIMVDDDGWKFTMKFDDSKSKNGPVSVEISRP